MIQGRIESRGQEIDFCNDIEQSIHQSWIAAVSGCMCISERDPDFIPSVRIGNSVSPVLRVQPPHDPMLRHRPDVTSYIFEFVFKT